MIRNFKKPKSQRKAQRNELHMHRVSAEVKIDDTGEIINCRVFLTDLSPSGVGLFINEQIEKGTELSMVIEQPKHLYVKGEVVWCTPYTLDTKIISNDVFKFRIGVKFLFDFPEEQEALKKYCEELAEENNKKPEPKLKLQK